MRIQTIPVLALFISILLQGATALAQEVVFQASDQSFSVSLPANFGPASSPPSNTLLALEAPSKFSLFCQKGEAVELDDGLFAEKMKQNLYDGGAQIFGKARAPLAEQPAASFLVGGVVPGIESLFVFNKRPDAVYTFVLNYPSGQRTQAASLWKQIAPSFQFRPLPAESKG